MTNKTITLTDEEFNLFVQLMYCINQSDDGSFFLYDEDSGLIQECNDIIDRVS